MTDEKSIEGTFLEMKIGQENMDNVQRAGDSTRYFLLTTMNPQTNQNTHLGIGFSEKADAQKFYQAYLNFFAAKQQSLEHRDQIDKLLKCEEKNDVENGKIRLAVVIHLIVRKVYR